MARTKSLATQEETNNEELESSGVNIRLNSKYLLMGDSRQYILCIVLKKKETGEEYLSASKAYTPTLEGVFKWIYEKEIRTRDASTLAELLENSKQVKAEIKEMCREIDSLNISIK